jgi:hypothetical protein
LEDNGSWQDPLSLVLLKKKKKEEEGEKEKKEKKGRKGKTPAGRSKQNLCACLALEFVVHGWGRTCLGPMRSWSPWITWKLH